MLLLKTMVTSRGKSYVQAFSNLVNMIMWPNRPPSSAELEVALETGVRPEAGGLPDFTEEAWALRS